MAKETTGTHTPEALLLIAAELKDHAGSLEAAALLLQSPSEIAAIEVIYENSRKVGFEYVRNWVSAAKQAAYDARLEASQKNGVRKNVHAPEPGPKRPKS